MFNMPVIDDYDAFFQRVDEILIRMFHFSHCDSQYSIRSFDCFDRLVKLIKCLNRYDVEIIQHDLHFRKYECEIGISVYCN